MAADILQYAIGNSASTTLSSGVSNSATSIPLASDTNFQAKTGEGMIIIDEGTANEEVAYSTTVSGGSLTTPLVNRGIEGTSAVTHSSGATVKGILTAGMWNNLIDSLTNVLSKTTGAVDTTKVVTLTGTQTLTNKTLTAPKFADGGFIADANGNEMIIFDSVSSAVNEVTVVNGATGNPAEIKATGETNVELKLSSKGNKAINLATGYYQGFQSYTPSAAGTATLDLSLGNDHRITMPAGNITIAISNASVGQKFLIDIIQDGTGGRLVTWFSGISWMGGTAPTLTTTASKRDTFGFRVLSAGVYAGYSVGFNY